MKGTWPLWIVLAVALVVLLALPRHLLGFAYPLTAFLVSLTIASWIVRDAQRVQLRSYQTSLAWPTGILFAAGVLAWIVVLPWYLTIREEIEAGRVPRRPASSGSGVAA